LKNTSELKIKEFEELEDLSEDVDDVESELISKYTDKSDFVRELIGILDKEKLEGEKIFDFESRVIKDTLKVLNLENEN